MKESLHRNLHPELHSILLEFHRINGHPLRAVWRVYSEGCLDKLVLCFDTDSLVVEAEPYDDTIIFQVMSNTNLDTSSWICASSSQPWIGFVGEAFGWGWITINQQDALDGILLSFAGITPQLMLNVIGSSIEERVIHQSSESCVLRK